MRLAVRHHTRYTYSSLVTLGYNRAHLLPRETPSQRVLRRHLDVHPTPDSRWDELDPDGNTATYFTLERPHRGLEVSASSEVELAEGIAVPASAWEPWDVTAARLADDPADAWEAVLDSPLVRRSPELAAFAADVAPPGRPLVDVVTSLTNRVFSELRYLPGSTDVSTPADAVLRRREGVCQDFAHLAIGALRSVGLAARYVSGYLESEPADSPALVGAAASHAWCAVRLGDGSWLDFDPTNDLVNPERHVTIAWGRDYGDVAPLGGVVYSGGGTSSLSVSVEVRALD